MKTTVAPGLEKSAYNCPGCGAYAQQTRVDVYAGFAGSSFTRLDEFSAVQCAHCENWAIWYARRLRMPDVGLASNAKEVRELVREQSRPRLVFPSSALGVRPHPELVEDIRHDFIEAAEIAPRSPRGAAALLRLCVQKLCVQLGLPGKNLNEDIGELVKRGLPVPVQQALDSLRVVGNNAVHPGYLDLKDDIEIAERLFAALNLIAELMIAQPKQIAELYGTALTESQREAIKQRDQRTSV
jgi:hypothetical protein